MNRVCVAAGSNIDPAARLSQAMQLLRAAWPGIRFSRAYRNVAAGFAGEDFINLACVFETAESLGEVLAKLHAIELTCGRGREAPKWAPRAMDLDILLFGAQVGEFPGARLPRPDLLQRAYMLGPAAEVAGELVHPVTGRTLADHWRAFDRAAHPLHAVELPASAAASDGGGRG